MQAVFPTIVTVSPLTLLVAAAAHYENYWYKYCLYCLHCFWSHRVSATTSTCYQAVAYLHIQQIQSNIRIYLVCFCPPDEYKSIIFSPCSFLILVSFLLTLCWSSDDTNTPICSLVSCWLAQALKWTRRDTGRVHISAKANSPFFYDMQICKHNYYISGYFSKSGSSSSSIRIVSKYDCA